jgi:dTDP-4-amino-4,6-dideoxyglucose formyltransferase
MREYSASEIRLLIVSDNYELSNFLKKELLKDEFIRIQKVEFCYSANNKSPSAMIEFGATELNLKNAKDVDKILNDFNLVFSLHCKQIFPKNLVDNVTCINFHPGFNPYNRGWYPQAFSIVNGLPIGASIHLMDGKVDHGEIIVQDTVDVDVADNSLDVYRKVIQVEKKLIQENLLQIINGTFTSFKPINDGNYNSPKDFQEMCALNLEKVDKLGNFIRLLRATTHGNFRNAYFLDPDGKKYFVQIMIEEDI